MKSGQQRPVVVVGNGPVGQTTALLLARWGVRVVVLDAKPGRETAGSKSICQQRDVLDIWESVGAGSQIAEEGLTWTTARTFYRGEELFSLRFQDAGSSPFPPFVNISQWRTEQVLDERIAAQPLIETRWHHRVVALAEDADGVVLACETPRGRVEVTAPYAVVCSGAHSDGLRARLGVTFEGRTFDDQFLICDIRTDLPGWEHERRFYFDPVWNPGRQVLIHPCPDSTFRIDWQVPLGFDLGEQERSGGLEARIRQVVGERDFDLVWCSVYRFQSRVADRMRAGRFLLAGDAAHLMAPFGARGLNSGVQDAENAAWKLAFVLSGWASEELLESYHQERHAAAVENLEVTTATMRFLVPQTDEERRHRRQALDRARDDPAARAQVDSGRLAEPFWYVDSPLTTPDPAHPFPGRPPKGALPPPGPGVVVPDLPVRSGRLRTLLREGITVLVGPDAPRHAVFEAAAQMTAPVQVHGFEDLSPDLLGLVQARADEVWVVRPDAHVAAVLRRPSPQQVTAAFSRLLGGTPPDHA